MAKTARLNIRISLELKEKLKAVADGKGVSVAEFITDYIKQLPELSKNAP